MRDVGADEDHRLGEDLRTHGGHQDVVDAAQFDVDLQAQVRKRLRGGLVHVLHLDALGGDACFVIRSNRTRNRTYLDTCRQRVSLRHKPAFYRAARPQSAGDWEKSASDT